jgi:hypothetical protein
MKRALYVVLLGRIGAVTVDGQMIHEKARTSDILKGDYNFKVGKGTHIE